MLGALLCVFTCLPLVYYSVNLDDPPPCAEASNLWVLLPEIWPHSVGRVWGSPSICENRSTTVQTATVYLSVLVGRLKIIIPISVMLSRQYRRPIRWSEILPWPLDWSFLNVDDRNHGSRVHSIWIWDSLMKNNQGSEPSSFSLWSSFTVLAHLVLPPRIKCFSRVYLLCWFDARLSLAPCFTSNSPKIIACNNRLSFFIPVPRFWSNPAVVVWIRFYIIILNVCIHFFKYMGTQRIRLPTNFCLQSWFRSWFLLFFLVITARFRVENQKLIFTRTHYPAFFHLKAYRFSIKFEVPVMTMDLQTLESAISVNDGLSRKRWRDTPTGEIICKKLIVRSSCSALANEKIVLSRRVAIYRYIIHLHHVWGNLLLYFHLSSIKKILLYCRQSSIIGCIVCRVTILYDWLDACFR